MLAGRRLARDDFAQAIVIEVDWLQDVQLRGTCLENLFNLVCRASCRAAELSGGLILLAFVAGQDVIWQVRSFVSTIIQKCEGSRTI